MCMSPIRVLKGQPIVAQGRAKRRPGYHGLLLSLPFSCFAPAKGRRKTGKGKIELGLGYPRRRSRRPLPWAIIGLPLRGAGPNQPGAVNGGITVRLEIVRARSAVTDPEPS